MSRSASRLGSSAPAASPRSYAQALETLPTGEAASPSPTSAPDAPGPGRERSAARATHRTESWPRTAAGRRHRLHAAGDACGHLRLPSSSSKIQVLCEKPLGIDVATARAHVERGSASGRPAHDGFEVPLRRGRHPRQEHRRVGHPRRDHPVRERLHLPRRHVARWNSDPAISGGGVLIDNGTHSVDLVRYFLGPLAEVQAVEGKRVQGLAVEDTVRIFVRSEAVRWAASTFPGASTRSSTATSTLRLARHGARGLEGVEVPAARQPTGSCSAGYDKVGAFKSQLENFCGRIRNEEPLLITPRTRWLPSR